jgi:hypothetical protein
MQQLLLMHASMASVGKPSTVAPNNLCVAVQTSAPKVCGDRHCLTGSQSLSLASSSGQSRMGSNVRAIMLRKLATPRTTHIQLQLAVP